MRTNDECRAEAVERPARVSYGQAGLGGKMSEYLGVSALNLGKRRMLFEKAAGGMSRRREKRHHLVGKVIIPLDPIPI